MIKSIHFQNFKALRDAHLPLGPFTLIVGPNGSGKSTALQGFHFVLNPQMYDFDHTVSAGWENPMVDVEVVWEWERGETVIVSGLEVDQAFGPTARDLDPYPSHWKEVLSSFRSFSFEANALASPVQTHPNAELGPNGARLPAILSALSGSEPERFESLNRELQRWLPEFDRIVFNVPDAGMTEFLLRTSRGHKYRAQDLSHGTLFALAFLTLAYLPSPPAIICFEEPDRGIHPRLLSEIRDGMYRLAYPENFGESRKPVQVIATTHSPYLLDLYKEHPEEIVIAHKDQNGAHFERLSDKPHLAELLEGAPLGDIWFSGILGGVPSSP
jgi:predicted ATPase